MSPSDVVAPDPKPGSGGLGEIEEIALEKLLTTRLSIVARLMSRQWSRFLSKHFGISIAEWWMLGQLGQHSPRTLRWLAQATQTDKAQLSRAAAALVKKNYVRRRADPNDARSVLFWITSKGKRVFEEIAPSRLAVNKALLAKLSFAEREALFDSLDKITDYFLHEADQG